MEWLVSNRSTLQGPCASLGWKEGDIYVPSPDIKEGLEALEKELSKEDVVSRSFRRSLGLSRVPQKDLIPILIHVDDKAITSLVIRILVNLTIPVECLLPIHVVSRSTTGQETIRQLQLLLSNAKKAFLDVQATAAIVKTIKDILYNDPSTTSVVECDCNDVNNCLLLLRNILHVPDKIENPTLNKNYSEWQTLQNKLIWNFFAQGLDVALLLMMNNKNKVFWTVSMVQLLALLYKDQHVGKIQNLLSLVPDESDSSEDEVESDGSKCSGGNSSSCDSSKNGLSDSGCAQSSNTSSSHGRNVNTVRITYNNNNNNNNNNGNRMDESNDKSRSPAPQNQITEAPRSPLTGCRSPNFRRRYSIPMVADSPGGKSVDINTNCSNLKRKAYPTESLMLEGDSSGFYNEPSSMSASSSSEEDVNVKNKKSEERRNSTTYNNNLIIMTSSAKIAAATKHRSTTKKNNPLESDSSNEDDPLQGDAAKLGKSRSHPPVGRKARSIGIGRGLKCSPSICFDAALEAAASKGKMITKEGLLEKKKVPRMVAINLTHTPSEDDISNILKDFTLSFLHNGFADLVTDLKKMIVFQNPIILDKSHFLWLLTYFLRLSSTLSLSFHHVKSVISADIISYLTFEGVMMCEELEIFFRTQQSDIKPLLRRMHLLVTAFREVISTIDYYSKKPISKKEKNLFQELRSQIADMNDVRQVFLLLIRNYNPTVHSKQYLVDLITTNHMLLLLLEKVVADEERNHQFQLDTHLQQFANVKVMEQFGKVLEDYKTNSEFVNDCLFTIMHHVSGDLKSPQTLFQPAILKSFCRIMEDEENESIQTLTYWDDLMTYILNKFMKAAERSPHMCVRKLFGLMTVNSDRGTHLDSSACCSSGESSASGASSDFKLQEKEDALYWWYLQFEHDEDPIGRIVESLSELQAQVSRSKVIQELLTKGVITHADYEKLKIKEKAHTEDKNESDHKLSEQLLNQPEADSIHSLVLELTQAGMKPHLMWLQKVLLEACYVKLGGRSSEDKPLEDSVPYYSTLMNQSTPLVPYNDAQETALHSDMFVNLLHKLGFHLPADVGKVYPRIPCFWGADVLYSVASKLGPINKNELKFKLSNLENQSQVVKNGSENGDEDMDITKQFSFIEPQMPPCLPLAPVSVTDCWMRVVQRSKVIQSTLTTTIRTGFS